jgi:hypothetical protein
MTEEKDPPMIAWQKAGEPGFPFNCDPPCWVYEGGKASTRLERELFRAKPFPSGDPHYPVGTAVEDEGAVTDAAGLNDDG